MVGIGITRQLFLGCVESTMNRPIRNADSSLFLFFKLHDGV